MNKKIICGLFCIATVVSGLLFSLKYMASNDFQKESIDQIQGGEIWMSISEEGDNQLPLQNVNKRKKEPSAIKKHIDELSSIRQITVSIIDTGIKMDEFLFPERIINPEKITAEDNLKYQQADENGHGTEMAEIIAENSSPYVKIMPLNVTDKDGKSTVKTVCDAIYFSMEQGVDIINLSMNTLNSSSSALLEQTINDATDSGITVVVSAGNKNVDVKNIAPANVNKATVIAAVDTDGLFASYSNYGDTIDYSAVGNYKGKYGTSYSAACFSGILAEWLSKGESAELLDSYLLDRGSNMTRFYGKGTVSLEDIEIDLFSDIFGEGWEATEKESSILKMGDFHLVTNDRINRFVTQSDLADVGYYLCKLSESELLELLERDTILRQNTFFGECKVTGEELFDEETIGISEGKNYPYYKKCLEAYEREKEVLSTSSNYLHKTGCFRLSIIDETGMGYSTTYEICVRVCLESRALDGNSPTTGKLSNRNINYLGTDANSITVWSNVSAGCSDTVSLNWQKVGTAYAYFYADDTGAAGRVFVPNIAILCPGYTLMHTADAVHANGGNNCTGRRNFFTYSQANKTDADYVRYRTQYRLRKYNMQYSPSYQSIGPQINTSHMNIADSALRYSQTETICTMFVCLNKPMTTLTINPNGEKWGGKKENTTLTLVNETTYELGTTTETNYKATFYGGGDALDPVADTSIITNKKFDHWGLTYSANGTGQIGTKHASMNGNTFVAGRIEYDQENTRKATTGEKVVATAIFSGSNAVTYPDAPQRTGYTFAGWYTGATSGAGTLACSRENAGKNSVILTEDLIFHAEWIKNNYSVSFYNGSDLIKSKQFPYRSDVNLAESITKEDQDGLYYVQGLGGNDVVEIRKDEYVLVGWSLENGGNVVASVNIPANHNTSLYAIWSRPTSGMKQIAVSLESGEESASAIIPTEGNASINRLLGLRAFFYNKKIPIIVNEEVSLLADGHSFAEDNAGNKTPLDAGMADVAMPIRYTFIYKYYTYDAVTKEWNYMENLDTWEIADIFSNETYDYAFDQNKMRETPRGYIFHHAEYEGQEIELPYQLSVLGMDIDSETIYTVEVFYYPISCKITFMANGGRIKTEGLGDAYSDVETEAVVKNVLYKDVLGNFPSAEKGEFYDCTGFYYDEEGNIPADMNDLVQGDTVLYAGWETKSGIVRFDASTNGGTIADEVYLDVPIIYESDVPYADYSAMRENYEFIGWSEQAQSSPGETIPSVLQYGVNQIRMMENGMSLYAQFKRNLQIRFHQFDKVECGLNKNNEFPVIYNNETGIFVQTPQLASYGKWESFGWTRELYTPDEYEIGENTEIWVGSDEDFYAVYKREVTLSYHTAIPETENQRDGNITFDNLDTAYAYKSTAGSEDLEAEFVIREGPNRMYYSFLYWLGSDGKKYYPGDFYASVEDLELTAIWEPDTALVIYDAGTNGGNIDGEPQTGRTVAYGNEIYVNKEAMPAQKDGYEFLGWNTSRTAKEGLSETSYMNAAVMDEGVLTLYAIYKKEVRAFFYQVEEAEPVIVVGALYNNDESVMVHAPCVKDYFEWESLGWTSGIQAKSKVELCSDVDFMLFSDTNYYASYQKEVVLSYDTGERGLQLEDCLGYTFHNSSYEGNSKDEPAEFFVSGPIRTTSKSFISWVDENGKSYAEGETLFLKENKELTAKWDEYPAIQVADRYFTLNQLRTNFEQCVSENSLLDRDYVQVSDMEDEASSLIVKIVDYHKSDFVNLNGDAKLVLEYRVTDSFGNTNKTYATIHIIDTEVKENPLKKSTRFISDVFYKKNEEYVDENYGGIEGLSLWRLDRDYARVLEHAMQNYSKQEPDIRYTSVFTGDDIKRIKQSVYEEKAFGNYYHKDSLQDFVNRYVKECTEKK